MHLCRNGMVRLRRPVWIRSASLKLRVNGIMWFRLPICVSRAGFSRRLAALLAFGALFGALPAAAESTRKQELEQRVMDITHMFQNDPRYNRGRTPEQIKDSVEFVTGNVLFVLVHETAHA